MRSKTSILGTSLLTFGLIVCLGLDTPAQRGPGGRGVGRGFGGPAILFQFDQIDTNQDESLSKEEIADWAWSQIARLDEDNDGTLAKSEAEQLRGAGRGFEQRGLGQRGPGQRGSRGGGAGDVNFEGSTLPKNAAEEKVLNVLEEINRTMRVMSVPEEDGRLLRLLAEAQGAKNIVEIGTSTGYSGTWLGLALLGTKGKLTTFEINSQRAALARENFKKAGLDSIITVVEGDAHEKVSMLKDPIDLLFLDADKQGYIDYLNKLLPLVRPGGLIVAHNMNQRQADPDYVEAITTDPDLETIFLHKDGAGVGVTMKKR